MVTPPANVPFNSATSSRGSTEYSVPSRHNHKSLLFGAFSHTLYGVNVMITRWNDIQHRVSFPRRSTPDLGTELLLPTQSWSLARLAAHDSHHSKSTRFEGSRLTRLRSVNSYNGCCDMIDSSRVVYVIARMSEVLKRTFHCNPFWTDRCHLEPSANYRKPADGLWPASIDKRRSADPFSSIATVLRPIPRIQKERKVRSAMAGTNPRARFEDQIVVNK